MAKSRQRQSAASRERVRGVESRRNPEFGPYRVELRDVKGRFTHRYSSARFFRLHFDGRVVSDLLEFPPRSSAGEKQYAVLLETDREAQAAYRRSQAAKRAARARQRRPEREPPRTPKKPREKRPRADEAVPEALPEKPEEAAPKVSREGLEERVEGLPPPEERESFHDIVSDAAFEGRVNELKIVADEVTQDPSIGSDLVLQMEASSLGVESHPVKIMREGRSVFERGSTIHRLEMNGMKRRNMIWWIAKEYLRQLGHEFFENVAFRYSKSILSFRIFLVTNLVKHKQPILVSPPQAFEVIFRMGVTKSKDKKAQLDAMTWQLVQAIMKALYADGRYPSGSLTSSEAFYRVRLPSLKSVGKKSIKIQNFKLAFTLILQLE